MNMNKLEVTEGQHLKIELSYDSLNQGVPSEETDRQRQIIILISIGRMDMPLGPVDSVLNIF